MVRSSHADCAPQAYETGLLHRPRLANGLTERLIGSARRECVLHIIVMGEVHLHRVLKSYARYYNGVRTHRSFNNDAQSVARYSALVSFVSFTCHPWQTLSRP